MFAQNRRMTKKRKFYLFIMSAFVGFLNGFFGGGGGMVCVPMLEKNLSISNRQSHATAIAVILPISVFSAFVWGKNTSVDAISIVWIGVGSLLGGIIGANLLSKISGKYVRLIFSFLVLVAGIKVIFW